MLNMDVSIYINDLTNKYITKQVLAIKEHLTLKNSVETFVNCNYELHLKILLYFYLRRFYYLYLKFLGDSTTFILRFLLSLS
jgi:hypothetical protein